MRYSRWDQRISTKDTNDVLKELATVHISRINSSAVREYLASCIASDSILDLCNYSPAYEELSVSDAINIRQICAFFSKRGDIDVGIDRRASALRSFIDAEKLCLETNHIFRKRAQGEFSFLPGVEPALLRTQRKIASFLGDVPSLEDLKFRFGPGATTQVEKRIASPARKLGEKFACSEDMLPVVKDFLAEFPTWVDANATEACDESWKVPVVIHNGKLRLVPKSYKTERVIAVEPMLCTLAQLGINDYLTRRFKRFGLDLTDQTANQRAALEGSLTGALATLDLSSASDTIAVELVFDLLPRDWYFFLSQFRTGRVDYEGVTISLQKFSSNGNGFTFPLESLIFYSLACSVVKEEDHHLVRTFGDDIIVPTYAFDDLSKLLHYVGFSVNRAKSFGSGCFRESCGADYMKGIDIRPSYVKDRLALFDIFRLHNQYVRRGDVEMASILLNHIPDQFRKFGPDGYGDGHLIGDQGLRPHGRDRGWSGYVFETYTMKPKRDFSTRPGDRVYPFYCSYASAAEELAYTSPEEYAEHFQALSPGSYVYRKGKLGVSIPGIEGVNLIKIYTLSPRY